MASSDVWSTIAAERRALASDLGSLPDAKWQTASLCDGWTVQDVLGHMTATAGLTPARFFAGLIGSGFSFEKLQAKSVAQQTEGPPAETLARFEAIVGSTKHPPGPIDSWLGETVLHAEDIRRPLGIQHTYPPAAVTQSLDFYRKSNSAHRRQTPRRGPDASRHRHRVVGGERTGSLGPRDLARLGHHRSARRAGRPVG